LIKKLDCTEGAKAADSVPIVRYSPSFNFGSDIRNISAVSGKVNRHEKPQVEWPGVFGLD
jgi:hypothetical protein